MTLTGCPEPFGSKARSGTCARRRNVCRSAQLGRWCIAAANAKVMKGFQL